MTPIICSIWPVGKLTTPHGVSFSMSTNIISKQKIWQVEKHLLLSSNFPRKIFTPESFLYLRLRAPLAAGAQIRVDLHHVSLGAEALALPSSSVLFKQESMLLTCFKQLLIPFLSKTNLRQNVFLKKKHLVGFLFSTIAPKTAHSTNASSTSAAGKMRTVLAELAKVSLRRDVKGNAKDVF